MKYFLVPIAILISSFSFAEGYGVSIPNDEELRTLGDDFFTCHQAYRRSTSSEPQVRRSGNSNTEIALLNCPNLAQEAAFYARLCASTSGRSEGGIYLRLGGDFCHKAAEFSGFIVTRDFQSGADWRQSVRDSVNRIRTGTIDQIGSFPIVGRLIRMLPQNCQYNYEENISPSIEGVANTPGVRQRDVPGISAQCDF